MTAIKTAQASRRAPWLKWILLLSVLILGAGIWWVSAASGAKDAGPSKASLPADTSMGAVQLVTNDLEPMREYYVNAVGLDVLQDGEGWISLGLAEQELLRLSLAEGLAADNPREAGLFHTAILYPDGKSLAEVLVSIADKAPASYGGSADHAVSHAFYFADPDGNGLELYVDTPEEDWVWDQGLVQMGSAPLDPNLFIGQHLNAQESTGETTMGHVHLRVGDLEQAEEFYVDALGFALTAQSDGALFYAVDGYHHHLATNTWNSSGAAQRPASQGLEQVNIMVRDSLALSELEQRLADHGHEFSSADGAVEVEDPWGNSLRISATP